jgi:glyoxylase-like metal-dependent hydrolase (beta-lactamase superfamily II)
MAVEIRRFPIGVTNSYLIKERGLIMIDAGPRQNPAVLQKRLEALSVNPKDVSLIVLTHGHWDHIACLSDLKKITGSKVAINHREREWVEKALKPFPRVLMPSGVLGNVLTRLMAATVRFSGTPVDFSLQDDGMSLEPFGISGKVVHTPGHTQGSMSVLLDTGDAFVGDLAMNGFPLRFGPGMPPLGDDANTVKTSWRLLLDRGAKKMYPAHGKAFPADALEKKL